MEPVFELAIELPPKGSGHLLQSLHRQLRDAIAGGRLQSGLQLPPTRVLAAKLAVSRNTVMAAYDLLLSEGYLEGRTGAGTFVADVGPKSRPPKAVQGHAEADRRLAPSWRTHGIGGVNNPIARFRYDFRTGMPDTTQFPFDVWQRLYARACRAAARERDVPTDLQGRPRLRAAIAKHVSFARAVACQPDDIVVTTGTRQSVDLLSRILVTAGETQVAIEDPCFPPLRLAFLAAGARVHPVPVDEEGLVVERLPADARVICVSPSHQYPLGVAMSARRRAALLEFARTNGAVIVEDDYDSEFRLDGRPLDALQTLDRDQTVFYIGTFSKSLFIGPRVGFVATPPWARRALVSAKHTFDGSNPVLTQETLASFIAEGHLARHIRKMRKIYSERHALLLAALTRHCKDRVHPISAFAGVHVAAELTGTMSAEEICARALDVGIRLDPIDRYAFRQGAQTGLVFGYGMIGSGDIEPAIGELARVIEAC